MESKNKKKYIRGRRPEREIKLYCVCQKYITFDETKTRRHITSKIHQSYLSHESKTHYEVKYLLQDMVNRVAKNIWEEERINLKKLTQPICKDPVESLQIIDDMFNW